MRDCWTPSTTTPCRAIEQLAQHVDRWWLHIDLDVLDPLEFAAQGLPDVEDEPGGLGWDQLIDLVRAMLDSGSCVGASIAIYDPDQDESGTDAGQIVTFVRTIVGGYREGR
jgi:arginase